MSSVHILNSSYSSQIDSENASNFESTGKNGLNILQVDGNLSGSFKSLSSIDNCFDNEVSNKEIKNNRSNDIMDTSNLSQDIILNDCIDSTLNQNSCSNELNDQKIPVYTTTRKRKKSPVFRPRAIRTVKRSNKVVQALALPTVVNINPRSIYNKLDEFHTFVEEYKVDLIIMSESWERETLQLPEKKR